MSELSARILFCTVMGTGVAIWCWSLILACRTGSHRGSFGLGVDKYAGPIEVGELTITGSPESISAGLIEAFQPQRINPYGAKYCVVEDSFDRVVLHKVGAVVCNQPAGLLFSDAVFQMTAPDHDRVTVAYALGFDRLARLTRAIVLWIILGIGLPVLLVVGSVIWFLVIPSQLPSVRGQVLQTLQIAHALWPPFLFLGILRIARQRSRHFVEQLVLSLAAEQATAQTSHSGQHGQ